MLSLGLTAHAQTPVDSTLSTKPMLMDSLALAAPEAQTQPNNPTTVFAAVAVMILAGVVAFLLYNVRSR